MNVRQAFLWLAEEASQISGVATDHYECEEPVEDGVNPGGVNERAEWSAHLRDDQIWMPEAISSLKSRIRLNIVFKRIPLIHGIDEDTWADHDRCQS